jgi:phage replication O-like protein O
MSNTAEIIQFSARSGREEQRVADTDDGFMRVANELTDQLLLADLTARQLKIMLAVMRKTYGFNKSMDRITNTQIAAMTGIHHTHVCSSKRQLIERGFLVQGGSKVGINKYVSMWDMKKISQSSECLADSANKSLAETANTHSLKQLNTKDNIQKTIKTVNTSADADDASLASQNIQTIQQQNPEKDDQKKPALSCEEVLAVYHEVLPEAKGVRLLSDKRRNQIRTFWKKATKITRQLDGVPFTLESWRQYLTYIAENCRWMLEDRQDQRSGRVWHRKGLEYFLNDETYLLVREGSKDDR